LSVVPYYNKPTQAGLFAHFSEIVRACGLPIILYDVPSRSACGLADETIARLAENAQFIGVKDASGDVMRPLRLRPLVGPEFRLLSGDDASAFAFLVHGGDGCISVASNVAPGMCRSMYLATRQGQTAKAQRWAGELAPLTAALFRESNPAPVKYALHLLGLMSARVRLPLVAASESTTRDIAAALADLCEHHADYIVAWPARGAVPNVTAGVAPPAPCCPSAI
jgi:4-hydroxy-tetrahydrodipicolinate synthase